VLVDRVVAAVARRPRSRWRNPGSTRRGRTRPAASSRSRPASATSSGHGPGATNGASPTGWRSRRHRQVACRQRPRQARRHEPDAGARARPGARLVWMVPRESPPFGRGPRRSPTPYSSAIWPAEDCIAPWSTMRSIRRHLDQRRAHALGCELRRLLPDGRSVLTFAVVDQAALYGLLARLRDAGVELVAAGRIAGPDSPDGGPVAPGRGRPGTPRRR
jgi:hypothetical protein